MSDIDTVWNNDKGGRGDYVLKGADLAKGHDLQTQFLISLFSDRQANADDILPDGTTDRRGWWGDTDEPVKIGSRLWLLERSKLSQEVAIKAQEYAREALQWMVDDGIVAAWELSTTIVKPNQLRLHAVAFRTKGDVQAKNSAWAWTGEILYPPS